MLEQIKTAIEEAIPFGLALQDSDVAEIKAKTVKCKPQFGLVTNSACMALAKKLQMKPVALADKIAKSLTLPEGVIVTVAGPGFLNFSQK